MFVILIGAPVAAARKAAVSAMANSLKEQGISPCLGIILAGDDAASGVYSQRLVKLGEATGVEVIVERLPATVAESEVLAVIDRWNADPSIHSILPMMPMPKQINAAVVAERLLPLKDADSLHPLSAGLLAAGKVAWAPCTPRAVMAILEYYQIQLAGRHAVVIGRSSVVGKPLAQLLLAADATVTVCHSKTADLAQITRQGDIVIAAAGRPAMLRGDMVKPGAVVIDVGINEVEQKIVGDVDFDAMRSVALAVTPVPGGVGTVSAAMVMEAVVSRWFGGMNARFTGVGSHYRGNSHSTE